MQPKPKQKPCARCGKARDANGRYCRQCRATYMRKWRSKRVTVQRTMLHVKPNGNGRCCPYCGQSLPEIRLNVKLSPLKARIFDIILRAGPDGISAADLHDVVFDNGQSRETLRAHIWQISDAIADAGYRIRGRDSYYALVTNHGLATRNQKTGRFDRV